MTDKIEETIKAIAVKHGIAVGRDDPILILQTINERLMQDSAAAQQEILDRFKEELEAVAHRWSDDAKNKAERTLNAALVASRETMHTSMQSGSEVAMESMKRQFEDIATHLARPVREAKQVAFMNIAASIMTVIAAGIVFWTVI